MWKSNPPSVSLGTFLAVLFQFIKQLGLEHCNHLEGQGTPNKFITDPVLRKAMWDRLKGMHPKILSCSYIYKGCGKTLSTKKRRGPSSMISSTTSWRQMRHILRCISKSRPGTRNRKGVVKRQARQKCLTSDPSLCPGGSPTNTFSKS
jgi:hypothetical protein